MSQIPKKPSEGIHINIHPTAKQYAGWLGVNNDKVDDVILGGAAGGGKSWFGSEFIVAGALQYPGSKQFIGRNELKRLMQSSFITLTTKVLPHHGLKQGRDWKFNGQYNVLHFANGSTVDMLDLAKTPADPLFERFGSLEYTRGWIEEASEVSFRAYDVLKSRVGRHLNKEMHIKSKLLLTLNPSQDWPYRIFYAPWKEAGRPSDPETPLVSQRVVLDGEVVERTFVFIQTFYKDNPYTADEYGKNLATISDPVMRARLREGNWEYSDAKDTLFDAQSIADMFKVSAKPSTEKFLIVDVARFGGAKIVLMYFEGWKLYKVEWKQYQAIPQTVDMVRNGAQSEGIPWENVLIDEDGVGGGVVDYLPGCLGFSGGATPFGKVGEEGKEIREQYDNMKAQCAYHLSQQVRERKVQVAILDTETNGWIAEELPQYKRRDADRDGKLKISRKEDIQEALGRSPDFADCLIMRSYFDLRKREPAIANSQAVIHVHIPED